MFKYLSICIALVAVGINTAYAQVQEAVLQTVAVRGAEFDLIVATPDPEGGIVPPNLQNTPEALIVPLHGGKLALVFDDPWEMVKAFDSLRTPVGAFETPGRGGHAPEPVALYIVPKGDTTISNWHVRKTQGKVNARWLTVGRNDRMGLK